MVGKELAFDSSLNRLERLYVSVLGAPISGLRIRVRRLMPTLERIVRDKSEEGHGQLHVIDVGCGTGVFSFEVAKRFPHTRVLGVDNWVELVEKDIQIAGAAGLSNCKFQVADVMNLATQRDFDIAVCIDNLEHIEDDATAIANIRGCLRPDGLALFHVPGLYRRWLLFGKHTNFDVKGHVRPGYTLEEIRSKVESAGFSILEAHYTYGWLETVTNNLSYLITGADRRNKYTYALIFPLLNALAFFGQWARPSWGAGVVVLAQRSQGPDTSHAN